MHIRQSTLLELPASAAALSELAAIEPHLVLAFAPDTALARPGFARELQHAFPTAQLVGCSSAGEIGNHGVTSGAVVLTALHFRRPNFHVAQVALTSMAGSHAAGAALGRALARPDLKAVLLFCPGVGINGSALLQGLASAVGPQVLLSGGLAGDDGKFTQTWTLCDGVADSQAVVGIGLFGEHWRISHGSFGGWQPFGPARRVTRCEGNVLFELDGQPALDVYRRYLGEYAAGLPATGLLFPFSMLGEDRNEVGLIRTILGLDEAANSLTLAGEIIPNGYLRLMHASNDALVDGAETAAHAAFEPHADEGRGLALLVSCVGRKLVMGGRVEEEIEAVSQVFGSRAQLAGFYSNGEISPTQGAMSCALHNQTMTITFLNERA